MREPVVLSSQFRRTMKVIDNGEQLVDLRTQCPRIAFEIADYLKEDDSGQNEQEDAYFVRETVAKMINDAQDLLPDGLILLARCGYRSPEVQARQYRLDYENLRAEHPDWSVSRLDLEIEKRTDPPDVSSHCTGGGVDLSLVDSDGLQLDMGTKMGEFNERAYTNSELITASQVANRKILMRVLEAVGFLNFSAEWWHWSYGDREWAHAHNQQAIFSEILRESDLETAGTFTPGFEAYAEAS